MADVQLRLQVTADLAQALAGLDDFGRKLKEVGAQTAEVQQLVARGAATSAQIIPYERFLEAQEAFKKTGLAGEEMGNKLGQSGRHVVALFDEFARGQRGAMISSLSALAAACCTAADWRAL